MIPRIVPTPIAAPATRPRAGTPRRVSPDVLEAVLPGPGRDRLAGGEVLVVTTGQQPGLFTGPLYTIYKALSAIALAARLERERRVSVVPVFWVAGDDHDFAEASHCTFLDAAGEAVSLALPERPAAAPQLPLFRERCTEQIVALLEQLRVGTPETEFKPAVLDWLARAYRPDASLAEAFAEAMQALLGARGLAILRAHAAPVKRAAAPFLLKGLEVTLPDGLTPVLVEAREGRDRLRADGPGRFKTRRSGEPFTRSDLERVAATDPERLSPNVLLRPAVEAALLPSVAYAAGPGELAYLADAGPCYRALGLDAQTPVPRWSGMLVESRVDKMLERHGVSLADLEPPPGALEGRLARATLPTHTVDLLAAMRNRLTEDYERLAGAAAAVDPTLERTVQSARNAALGGIQDVEKKLIAQVKRTNETLVSQVVRARAAIFPLGIPQERSLTAASILLRYGPALLDAVAQEVARWTDAS